MKSINIYKLSCLSLILFLSCNNNSFYGEVIASKEIYIDAEHQESLSLDSIIEKLDYIKLETINDNLIGQISQLFFIDSLIVIADSKSSMTVQVYNFKGKYIRTIGFRGNGPGEYNEVSHVSIDNKNNIIILDRSQNRIIRYTIDGKLISMSRTSFQLDYFEVLESGNIVYFKEAMFDPKYGKYKNKQLVLTDSIDNLLNGDFTDLYKSDKFDYFLHLPLRKFADSVYYSPLLSNVIYNITDRGFIPKYKINIVWNGMPIVNKNITNSTFNEYCKKYFYFNGDFIELKDLTYLNIATPVGYPFVVYSHIKGKTFFCTEQGGHPLFPFLKGIAPKARYKDNAVVFDIYPYSLIVNKSDLYRSYPSYKKMLDELYEGLTENSNQILLICHLNKKI